MKDGKLEAGDVLYDYGWLGKINRFVIDRTTKTMAISGSIRFKIDVHGGRVYYIGRGYDRAFIDNDEIRNKFEVQELISKITPEKVASLSREKLEIICKILE